MVTEELVEGHKNPTPTIIISSKDSLRRRSISIKMPSWPLALKPIITNKTKTNYDSLQSKRTMDPNLTLSHKILIADRISTFNRRIKKRSMLTLMTSWITLSMVDKVSINWSYLMEPTREMRFLRCVDMPILVVSRIIRTLNWIMTHLLLVTKLWSKIPLVTRIIDQLIQRQPPV